MPDLDHHEMLKEISEVASKVCSAWECSYIQSMQEWKGAFTTKQKKIIEEIYEKVCDSPY